MPDLFSGIVYIFLGKMLNNSWYMAVYLQRYSAAPAGQRSRGRGTGERGERKHNAKPSLFQQVPFLRASNSGCLDMARGGGGKPQYRSLFSPVWESVLIKPLRKTKQAAAGDDRNRFPKLEVLLKGLSCEKMSIFRDKSRDTRPRSTLLPAPRQGRFFENSETAFRCGCPMSVHWGHRTRLVRL